MNTTISLDKELRDRAAERAKKEKLPISVIVRILLSDYADGKIQIGTRTPEFIQMNEIEVDKETLGLMDDVINEWRNV